MSSPWGSYAHIWNGEQYECEECHEMTDEILEAPDLKHVCEECLNGMTEDQCKSHVN